MNKFNQSINQSINHIFYALTLALFSSPLTACPDSGCYARNASDYDLQITYTDTSGTSHTNASFRHDRSIDKIKPGTQMTVSGGPGRTDVQLTVDAGCVTISAAYDILDPHHPAKFILKHVNWCE